MLLLRFLCRPYFYRYARHGTGHGIDYVEPAFATLRRDPLEEVHGVATLLPATDAEKLDQQEASYLIATCDLELYDGTTMQADVYVRRLDAHDSSFMPRS